MGIIMHKDAAEANRKIEEEMLEEQKKKRGVLKLLLLGAGESGKSTVLKQMKILHANGFTEDDVRMQREAVFGNVVQAMNTILEAMKSMHIKFEDPVREVDANQVNIIVSEARDKNPFTESLSRSLQALWSDRGVQRAFQRSNEYQLNDSTQYFFDRLGVISAAEYTPSQEDMLRCRIKTTGVIEVQFMLKGVKMRVFDVGGQRSERKKWIHCFDDANAIIFVVAMSEYDQVLFEDGTTNRMHESLRLFDSICNNQWFVNTSMILFLNKKDLFEEKITKSSLTIAFPEYNGKMNFDEGSQFVIEQYLAVNSNPEKQVYAHMTCATDTGQVRFVIDSCMDMVISQNLQSTGLY